MTVEPLEEDLGSRRESLDLRLLTLIASLLVAATVSLTFAQVVLRYVFNNPQAWAEEVGRYLFVWITFLGAAAAFSRDAHIRVDVLVNRFGAKSARIGDLLRRLVEFAGAAALLYSGVLVAMKHRNATFYTIPEFPQVIFYLAVPVGSALTLFYILRGIVRWKRREG
jgi:TRAP-type C4-dicarboxylate transport system permease small subunit